MPGSQQGITYTSKEGNSQVVTFSCSEHLDILTACGRRRGLICPSLDGKAPCPPSKCELLTGISADLQDLYRDAKNNALAFASKER